MASERGRWLRDQTSARFGDWAISVGAAPSTTWGFVSVLEAGTDVAASNWRAVAEKERWLMANWRDSLWAARNLVAEIIVLGNWLVGATFCRWRALAGKDVRLRAGARFAAVSRLILGYILFSAVRDGTLSLLALLHL